MTKPNPFPKATAPVAPWDPAANPLMQPQYPTQSAAWVSVAPVTPAAPLNLPPDTAIDRETGEVLFEDDGVTPYNKDNLLMDWRKAKEAAEKAVAYERDLRGKVVACYSDPSKTTGTERIAIGNNWSVKVEKGLNYKLKSFDANVSNRTAVEVALQRLVTATRDSQGNELNPELGKVVAMRLVKWEPELSLTEYKQLLPGHREIIDTVLEVKPSSPTVSLVPPKEPKA